MASVQRDLVERAQRGDREAFGVLAAASIGQLYSGIDGQLRSAQRLADEQAAEHVARVRGCCADEHIPRLEGQRQAIDHRVAGGHGRGPYQRLRRKFLPRNPRLWVA